MRFGPPVGPPAAHRCSACRRSGRSTASADRGHLQGGSHPAHISSRPSGRRPGPIPAPAARRRASESPPPLPACRSAMRRDACTCGAAHAGPARRSDRRPCPLRPCLAFPVPTDPRGRLESAGIRRASAPCLQRTGCRCPASRPRRPVRPAAALYAHPLCGAAPPTRPVLRQDPCRRAIRERDGSPPRALRIVLFVDRVPGNAEARGARRPACLEHRADELCVRGAAAHPRRQRRPYVHVRRRIAPRAPAVALYPAVSHAQAAGGAP